MLTEFTKMHGLGNDYIYFDCIANPDLIPNPGKVAPRLSDRHFGIGGDGIVLILKADANGADYRMRMFNSDGSEAEMCGNAIRCVAKYLCDNGYLTGDEVNIQTGAGIKHIEITRNSNGKFESARVDMGEPTLDGLLIPVNIDKEQVIGESISLPNGREYDFTAVSMGNPHAIIFVEAITDEHVSAGRGFGRSPRLVPEQDQRGVRPHNLPDRSRNAGMGTRRRGNPRLRYRRLRRNRSLRAQ